MYVLKLLWESDDKFESEVVVFCVCDMYVLKLLWESDDKFESEVFASQ